MGNAVLVKDINPGINPSYPSNLTIVNGTTYFTAYDDTNGGKLWKIDSMGDAVLVNNINIGVVPSYLSNLTNVNGILYFTASNDTNGERLWKINNTGAAVLVKNLSAGNDSSYSSNFTNVNGALYFVTDKYVQTNPDGKGIAERKLWKINDTGDAVLVKNLSAGINLSYPSRLTNINGTLYFTVNDVSTGAGLWKIENSSGDAILVKDINSSANSPYSPHLTDVDGTLYFTADDVTNGGELWKINSGGNAVLVKDINPGVDSSGARYLTNVNGTLYFSATNSNDGGYELWKINSTGDPVLVKDINPGADSSYPANLTNVNGILYFTATNSINGGELWKVDNNGNAVLAKGIYSNNIPDNLFDRNLLKTTSKITGVSIQAISQKNTNKVNEIGFFNVDDRNGKINGIAPTEAGYIKAAIGRSKSILTTLGGNFFNTDKQDISLDPNKIYQFFEIEGGSLSDVNQKLAKGEVLPNIRLSIPDQNGNSPIKVTGINIQSGYDISINNDELVLKVTKLDGTVPNKPIGSESQGKLEGRIIDLTKYPNQSLKVDITTKSDAVYQSQIGFYVVKDALGTIELADGTIVKPGDANYAMVAVKNAIANAGLQLNRIDSKTNQPIAGGQIYAPVVVAQGTMNDFVNQSSKDVHAYFNYVGANTDNVDHFRQIGANTFGVEDMYGGGDRDFNDIVVQMNISSGLPK